MEEAIIVLTIIFAMLAAAFLLPDIQFSSPRKARQKQTTQAKPITQQNNRIKRKEKPSLIGKSFYIEYENQNGVEREFTITVHYVYSEPDDDGVTRTYILAYCDEAERTLTFRFDRIKRFNDVEAAHKCT